MEMVKLGGTIIYDPNRGKLSEDKAKNTIIIDIDEGEELASYYRYMFEKKYFISLLKPNYPIHMTVTKVQEPNDNEWGYLNKKKVEISRTQKLFWNNEFLWLNSFCPEWNEIRKFYGFPEYHGGHITIGKFKEYDKKIIESFYL